MTPPENKKLSGGELITLTTTLTRDQWSILFLLMHQSVPMLPPPSWATAEFIVDTLSASYETATVNND